MTEQTEIKRPNGTTYVLEDTEVHDLWHTAMYLRDKGQDHLADMVLETWHLASDLKKHVLNNNKL